MVDNKKVANVAEAQEVHEEGFFTDEMHRNMFVFQEGLQSKFTSKGGKIMEPVRTRAMGAIKGGRRISIR
jgi:hypothetical protein